MGKDLTTEDQKISYALGMDIGASFKKLPIDIDLEATIDGITDISNSAKLKLEQKEFVELMQKLQTKMKEAAAKHQEEASEENKKQEAEFLTLNRKDKEVVETQSGLQYKVMEEGKGDKPSAESVVKVHYTGTLLDGSIFDSSVHRGEPAQFPVNGVIPGWTEALQLMTVGSKYRLFIPANLAYGSRGAGQAIGPDQMLIFEVELLDIVG